jgi:hypothetical protein
MHFKNEQTSIDEEECSGWPSTVTMTKNVAKVQEAVMGDQWRTIHDVCNTVGLSYEIRQWILSDEFNMWCTAVKFVPSSDQKENHTAVCTELKGWAEYNPKFISNIITGDKSWMFGYDAETKQQSSQWKTPTSPWPKKAQVQKSMLIIFFLHWRHRA